MSTAKTARFERRAQARREARYAAAMAEPSLLPHIDKASTMTPTDVDRWIKRSGMQGNRTKRERRQR